MSLTVEEITKIMEKAKELGFSAVEVEGVKLQLGSPAAAPLSKVIAPDPDPDLKAEDIVTPMSAFDDLSDDEILYYATPYFDELQAQKAARQAELELEKKPRRKRAKASSKE